jgi:hypothetical protein
MEWALLVGVGTEQNLRQARSAMRGTCHQRFQIPDPHALERNIVSVHQTISQPYVGKPADTHLFECLAKCATDRSSQHFNV